MKDSVKETDYNVDTPYWRLFDTGRTPPYPVCLRSRWSLVRVVTYSSGSNNLSSFLDDLKGEDRKENRKVSGYKLVMVTLSRVHRHEGGYRDTLSLSSHLIFSQA